ncbi:hypothetical protein Dimus_007726 [Dionaea muscipula]
MMQGRILPWKTPYPYANSHPTPLSLSSLSSYSITKFNPFPISSLSSFPDSSAAVEDENLTPRERRKLRNERRERKPSRNWREEVEERLMKKPKKRFQSWMEELNLDNLADLGPQWWIVRVSRVSGQDTAQKLARSLSIRYPDLDFKVYVPAVQQKIKSKKGSYNIKSKPLFPGSVFLRCVLNKEIHDFIKECVGVRGFVGTKVGNIKRQINRPKPVPEVDVEDIFRQAKVEQEKADQAFEDELKGVCDPPESSPDTDTQSSMDSVIEAVKEAKQRGRSRKTSNKINNKLKLGSTVTVVSGAFAKFSGTIKKLDATNGKVTVGFTLFGKETIADFDIHEIVVETK